MTIKGSIFILLALFFKLAISPALAEESTPEQALHGIKALIKSPDAFSPESIRNHLAVPLPTPRCYEAFYLKVPKYECAAEFQDKNTESSLKVFRSSLKKDGPIVFGTLEFSFPKDAHPTLTRAREILELDFKPRLDEMIDFSWGEQSNKVNSFTAITKNSGEPLVVNLYVADGKVNKLSLTRNDEYFKRNQQRR
jgi:hypothetical protein